MKVQITERRLHDLPGPLLDADLSQHGAWAGIAGDEHHLWLVSDQGTLPLPISARYPLIRVIDEERRIVVKPRARGEPNAWIVTAGGQVQTAFSVGDGIRDVLIAGDNVIVTYFDEGVFSNIPPGIQGIAMFDTWGEYQWGYLAHFGDRALVINDCYCACLSGGTVFVIPYTDEYVLLGIDLDQYTRTAWPLPPKLRGTSALTVLERVAYCYGRYGTRDSPFTIVQWLPGNDAVSVLGTVDLPRRPRKPRGLAGGRFLSIHESGYTLISIVK